MAETTCCFEQKTKQAAYIVQAEFFGISMTSNNNIFYHISKIKGVIIRMQHLNVKPDKASLIVKLLDTLPDQYKVINKLGGQDRKINRSLVQKLDQIQAYYIYTKVCKALIS